MFKLFKLIFLSVIFLMNFTSNCMDDAKVYLEYKLECYNDGELRLPDEIENEIKDPTHPNRVFKVREKYIVFYIEKNLGEYPTSAEVKEKLCERILEILPHIQGLSTNAIKLVAGGKTIEDGQILTPAYFKEILKIDSYYGDVRDKVFKIMFAIRQQ